MQLLCLPTEIILSIADELPSSQDVLYFSLANRALFHSLLPVAYQFNIRHERSSALHWAIPSGRLELVRALIEQFHADVNAEHREYSPIFLAISHGKQDIVALLFSQGGGQTSGPDSDSPLHSTSVRCSQRIQLNCGGPDKWKWC